MAKPVYVLDRYANKNLKVSGFDDSQELQIGDKITYFIDHPNGKKLSLGTYIGSGYHDIEKEAFFKDTLTGKELESFHAKQKFALEKFPLFKKMFKKNFPVAIPVTSRFHIFSRQYYFYFYADERFQFQTFLKDFRQELGQNFFLFQVGARDMVKMSPATDNIAGCNGLNLCCKSNRPLPSVNVEALIEQHLEGRDIERLKGRCGKLKCSLLYEVETYITDNKEYPKRGSSLKSKECENCGVVTGYNIMNQMINVKTKEGAYFQLSLEELKKDYEIIKTQRKPVQREPRAR